MNEEKTEKQGDYTNKKRKRTGYWIEDGRNREAEQTGNLM